MYNDRYKMQDLFMNKNMRGLLPQFSRSELQNNSFNNDYIMKKIAVYLNNALKGTLEGINITVEQTTVAKTVEQTTVAKVVARVKSLKSVLEGMFNNIDSIKSNFKSNTKLYTTITSITQLKELKDDEAKLSFMNQVLDNIKYNPDFASSKNSRRNFKQELWIKKVGWKE